MFHAFRVLPLPLSMRGCSCVQPPIEHPPAGVLPFLDVESIRDTGFRLARFSRDDCCFMGPEGIAAKVIHIGKDA